MENIEIAKDKSYTPRILLDFTQGLLEIEGDSHPENVFEFYRPVIEGLKNYLDNPHNTTTVNLELNYFNSGTSKILWDIMDELNSAKEDNPEISIIVNWIFDADDEANEEEGEELVDEYPDLEVNLVTK